MAAGHFDATDASIDASHRNFDPRSISEGRRARHGASMLGPDYTHWHGMYEVGKHFYTEFLPAVIETAAKKSPELKNKYEKKIEAMLASEEHAWLKGLSPEEAEALRKTYKERYNQ